MERNLVFDGRQIVLIKVTDKRVDYRRNLLIVGNGFSIGDPGFHLPNASDFERYGMVLAMIFKPTCEGLEAAEEELVEFINNEYHKYNKVALYGHSKCGVMFYNLLSRLKNPVIALVISAPFAGCFWADAQKVKKKLWERKSLVVKIFNVWQYFLYKKLFSDHAVDRDIIPGSEYLKKAHPEFSVNHKVANIVSRCYSSGREIRRLSLKRFFFAKLNVLAGYGSEKGDGIVSAASQEARSIKVNYFVHANHAESFDKARVILTSYLGD